MAKVYKNAGKQILKKLNILCVKWGEKYPSEYVNRLYRMVQRNLSYNFEFYCLTDSADGLLNGIKPLMIENSNLSGWWHKLSMFKAEFYGLEGTILYFDLDVVITGGLEDLVDFRPGSFCTIQDTAKRKWSRFNTSVMRFEVGSLAYVWDGFVANQNWILKNMDGDQDWIGHVILDGQTFPREWIVSYKRHCKAQGHAWLGLGEALMKKGWIKPKGEAILPKDARVVIFHGKPDPEDVIEQPYKQWKRATWIKDYWH